MNYYSSEALYSLPHALCFFFFLSCFCPSFLLRWFQAELKCLLLVLKGRLVFFLSLDSVLDFYSCFHLCSITETSYTENEK